MPRAVTKEFILEKLPDYPFDWVLVKERQRVPDIIKLICEQHKTFAADYDCIGRYFIGSSIDETCDNLYTFCKDYLRYREESEDFQSVGNPRSIIMRGETGIDCKSYALFIGGCLDAIQRYTGDNIDWFYTFASYELTQRTPYHVFVGVNTDGGLLYCDPTPGANDKTPVWIIDKAVHVKGKASKVAGIGATTTAAGTLMEPPSWYPSYLPLFYNTGNGIFLHGAAVPGYSSNDILDLLLYYQTIVGYNRTDYQYAIAASWKHTDNSDSGYNWAVNALKSGNMGSNWANVSFKNYTIDGTLYSQLQARYIANEATALPWLVNMQGKGGGIDLMTIPFASDAQISRPSFYPNYLPSLFISGGALGQFPAGHLDTKPKIRAASVSAADYNIIPEDVAALMLYAQPVINAGPTPYPTNWYINDEVNGAEAFHYKISLAFSDGFTNSQAQTYGMTGDMMTAPLLDANPYASGFTTTLQNIVSAAVNYFAGKAGGSALVTAANYAATLSGGEVITGGPVPAGVYSAEVFKAADALAASIQQTATNKKYLLLFLAAAGVLTWYYWDDIKKAV